MNLKVDYEKLLDVGRLIKEKDSELKHVLIDFILIIDGVSNGSVAGEHMTSFYYGYNIERVRDWLFEQTK